eukprot:scaffold436370_cov49-Prasinocladus_malaysianus.AAC.1
MAHLGDAGLAIAKEQRQQRRDDSCLAGSHDELVADGVTGGILTHEAPDQSHLWGGLNEHDGEEVAGELKHEEAGVVEYAPAVLPGCPWGGMMPPCGDRLAQCRGLPVQGTKFMIIDCSKS